MNCCKSYICTYVLPSYNYSYACHIFQSILERCYMYTIGHRSIGNEFAYNWQTCKFVKLSGIPSALWLDSSDNSLRLEFGSTSSCIHTPNTFYYNLTIYSSMFFFSFLARFTVSL